MAEWLVFGLMSPIVNLAVRMVDQIKSGASQSCRRCSLNTYERSRSDGVNNAHGALSYLLETAVKAGQMTV